MGSALALLAWPGRQNAGRAAVVVGVVIGVMLALFVYVASVARRLGSVQRELERLETDIKRGSRA